MRRTFGNYFVIYNIETHITSLLQENSEYFQNLKNNSNNDAGTLRDFIDGILYKKLLSLMSEEEK